MTNLEVAVKYSTDLINDVIPSCIYTKQAAQRFLDDLDENSPYFYDEDEVDTLVDFCQSFDLTEVSPPTKTVLQPFQIWVLANVWGIKRKDNLRKKYRLANISVARGNAKTQLIALMCVYELLYGHDAQIIIASSTTKQTMEVDFDKIKKLCLQVDPRQQHIKIYYNKIVYNNNKIIVTSDESKPFDGLSGSLMLLDEMHLFTQNNIYGTLRSSMIKRTDNVLFVISTAGFDTDTEYYKLCEYSKKVLNKTIDDPSLFAALYTIDEQDYYSQDLYDNEDYIRKSNPMLGISVQKDTIVSELQVAKNSESDRISILTKHLNVFLKKNDADAFISEKYINRAMLKMDLDQQEFNDNEVCVGVDLSINDDITSVSYMIIKDDIYYFFNDFFIPSEALTTKRNRERYKEAAKAGYINIIEGNAIDYDVVIDSINKRNETHPIKLISFDKYNAGDFVKKLDNLNYYLVRFSQLASSMNAPLTTLQRLFLLNKIRIQYNPLTIWMLGNVVLKRGYTGLITIDKSNSDSNKIDVVASMADALGGYLIAPEYGFNIW